MKYPEKNSKEIRFEASSILWDKHLRKWYQKNEAQNDYDTDTAKSEFLHDIDDFIYLDGYDLCCHLDKKGWSGINTELVVLANNFKDCIESVYKSNCKKWVKENGFISMFNVQDKVKFKEEDNQSWLCGEIISTSPEDGFYIIGFKGKKFMIPHPFVKGINE